MVIFPSPNGAQYSVIVKWEGGISAMSTIRHTDFHANFKQSAHITHKQILLPAVAIHAVTYFLLGSPLIWFSKPASTFSAAYGNITRSLNIP